MMPNKSNSPDSSSNDLLLSARESVPDKTAIIDATNNQRHSYEEIFSQMLAYATAMEKNGITEASKVGIKTANQLEFYLLLHATWTLNAVAVPLNLRLTQHEISRQLEALDLECLVCDAETEKVSIQSHDTTVFSIDAPISSETESLEPAEFDDPDLPSPDNDQLRLIMFTSGTTDDPKAVSLSHENLLASAHSSKQSLPISEDTVWLDPLPLYHMGGLAPVIRAGYTGSTLLPIQWSVDRIIECFHDYEPTGISLIPTMLNDLFQQDVEFPSSLNFVLLGGAAPNRHLINQAKQRDLPLYTTYGMTETASHIAISPPEQTFEDVGRAVTPLEEATISIVDSSDSLAEQSDKGEIVVDGPMVCEGYYNNDQANEKLFGNRGFHTGDLGSLDTDGDLWIEGRQSDLIITGGETVDPDEVRKVLEKHSRIHEASVVGLEHPRWGEQVAALVVTEDEAPINTEEIKSFCRTSLAGYKCPRMIKLTQLLPRTSSGTIDRDVVRRRITSR